MFGIAWQRCPARETGGAPPVSAADQDLSAERPRGLVALVQVHRAGLAGGYPAAGDHQLPQSLRPACQRVKARLARRWRGAGSKGHPAVLPGRWSPGDLLFPGARRAARRSPVLAGPAPGEETSWRGAWMVQGVRTGACGVAGGARRPRRARCRLRRGHEGAAGDPVCGGCWAAAGRGDDRAVGPDARPYRRLARTRRDGEGPVAASGALSGAARGPLAGSVPAAWLLWHPPELAALDRRQGG